MRNTVVEKRQSIEAGVDEIEKIDPGLRLVERGAEKVAVVDDDGLAADGHAVVARQRKDVAQAAVGRIVVQALQAARHIEAEVRPSDRGKPEIIRRLVA